jgi:hypothetical protein
MTAVLIKRRDVDRQLQREGTAHKDRVKAAICKARRGA